MPSPATMRSSTPAMTRPAFVRQSRSSSANWRGGRRDRADRAGLGHAPALDHADAEAALERLHQRPGRRGAARGDEPQAREVHLGMGLAVLQDVVPDGRHPGADASDRSAWISRHSGSAWTNRSGMTMSAPDIQAEYGMPHALAWNIGTIDQRPVAVGERQRRGQARAEGVQEGGAVAVHDALGVAGRAARVTHRGCAALVEHGPLEAGPTRRRAGRRSAGRHRARRRRRRR